MSTLIFCERFISFSKIGFIALVVIANIIPTNSAAQLELTTSVAINRNDAIGPGLGAAYDFRIKGRFFTKSQIGVKYLHNYDDWIRAHLKVSIFEYHQTVSVQIGKRENGYVFKPNIGLNYRYYHWKGRMEPPFNTLPQRRWGIGLRNNERFFLDSFDENYHTSTYSVNNLGFSFQLQNQFRLSNKLWLHVTPFMEPDYDRTQNTGGVYVGVVLLEL